MIVMPGVEPHTPRCNSLAVLGLGIDQKWLEGMAFVVSATSGVGVRSTSHASMVCMYSNAGHMGIPEDLYRSSRCLWCGVIRVGHDFKCMLAPDPQTRYCWNPRRAQIALWIPHGFGCSECCPLIIAVGPSLNIVGVDVGCGCPRGETVWINDPRYHCLRP
jgi:hypothetical protein